MCLGWGLEISLNPFWRGHPSLLMPNFLSNIPLLTCMDPNSLGNGCLSFRLLPAELGLECPSLASCQQEDLVRAVDAHPGGEQYEEVVREVRGWYPCCIRTSLYLVDMSRNKPREKVEETGSERNYRSEPPLGAYP